MKTNRSFIIIFQLIIFIPLIVRANPFVAYSLKEAEKRLMTSGAASNELSEVGHITEVLGMVYDAKNKDFIIIGVKNGDKAKIFLDDFVVAMRAVFNYNKPPLVSIDKTSETVKTKQQIIYWEGGIENTKLGKDMLESDILLKNLALGKLTAEIWGLKSYVSLIAERATEGKVDTHIGSRFWFKNFRPSLAIREDVFAILDLQVKIETEVTSAEIQGQEVSDLSSVNDQIGEIFAKQATSNLTDLSLEYPILKRVKPILALVSLAEGMRTLRADADLDFWLKSYNIPHVDNIKYYNLIEVTQEIENNDLVLTVSGGIELNPIILRLNAGDVTALREAVLNSKPSENALIWNPPLAGWAIPGADNLESATFSHTSFAKKNGFSVDRVIYNSGQSIVPTFDNYRPMSSPKSELSGFNTYNQLPTYKISPNVGGVMLQGAATVSGDDQAAINFAAGNFSLVVDGDDSRIDPKIFQKFVTALWSVYYSEEPPGISIDPIAPDVDQHLVRYIGNVINNDLGRVMREADYTMKKWAVGTERPDIAGFKSPDQYAMQRGVYHVGAYSRFWFVPEEMKFTQANNILMFESGTMKLKTEYWFSGGQGKSSPENEDFAKFFTKYYDQISEKYPVYKELFEYAKLVSLAQYLKQCRTPLFWFLMANKDLIITEDSPGTVNELVKGLNEFPGIQVMGGVELDSKQGQYVYDTQAVSAINEAISRLPATNYATTSLSGEGNPIQSISESFSFDVGKKSYTVLPQHSPTSGKDRRGIRYQTDIALKNGEQPGLEFVRYFDPMQRSSGEFGDGWHLLIPYRISAANDEEIQFQNVLLPKKMILTNLISSDKEILEFSEDRYSIVGYVPDSSKHGQTLGLFLMNDLSYRLADKLGNEFHFDQSGYMTEMLLGGVYEVRYDYVDDVVDNFEGTPFELRMIGDDRAEFLNVSLPKKLLVQDSLHHAKEEFIFHSKWGIGAYIPENSQNSNYQKIILMTDGSFRLYDRYNNKIEFDPTGSFGGVIPNDTVRVIRAISQGDQTISFKYSLGKNNSIRISQANLIKNGDEANPTYTVNYYYDQEDRLARIGSNEKLASR